MIKKITNADEFLESLNKNFDPDYIEYVKSKLKKPYESNEKVRELRNMNVSEANIEKIMKGEL